MSCITNLKSVAVLVGLTFLLVPTVSFARDNSLTGGMSVGLDLYDRSSDDADDDDYKSIFLTPMLQFISLGERDTFELQASPSLRHELEESETDWNSNLSVAADRFMTRSWQLGISNHYLKSDSYDTDDDTDVDADVDADADTDSTDPSLSSNRGRTRYSLNTLNLFSDYFYREESLLRFDFSYITLRNDDTGFDGDEDYDRYLFSLRDEHRFNAFWSSIFDFRYVIGDYDQPGDELSDDLKEYHLLLELENESIANNPLSLSYNYIATRYDETLQDDSDIHQMRLNWRRDHSSRLYTILGIGPSYEKTQGRDATWGVNGIAEANYTVEHGFFNFQVEKVYDVENFSGSDESGLTDSWITLLSGSYQLQRDLTFTGRLSYIYEDREETLVTSGGGGDSSQLDEYHNDRYIAGAGLDYTFWQFYNASIEYTFIKQDSDRASEEYDDHRLLLTLSWEQELLRW